MSNTLASSGRQAVVLLVEDNENDTELMKIGLKRTRFSLDLHHVPDGEECMAFLRKEGKYSGVPTPDLILLDLNMPRMDGREVLEDIGRDENLRHLVVVVMTSSDADNDVLTSYKLRCSSYVVKPIDFKTFSNVVQSLADYWFALVVLPPQAHSKSGR